MLEIDEGQIQINRFKLKNNMVSIGNGIFRYHWHQSSDDIFSGLMWLVFFDFIVFWAFIGISNEHG